MKSEFNGKTALITGAAQGIGGACARYFAEHGIHHLILTDRQEDKLNAFAAEFADQISVDTITADLANPQDIINMVQSAMRIAKGAPDFFVGAAGTTERGSLDQLNFDQLQRIHMINSFSYAIILRQLASAMALKDAGGQMVLISSVHAYGGDADKLPYAMSKAALDALVKTTGRDMRKQGLNISINGINLGRTATEGEHETATKIDGLPENWLEKADAASPTGRIIRPEEVAEQVAQLILSDKNGEMVHFSRKPRSAYPA